MTQDSGPLYLVIVMHKGTVASETTQTERSDPIRIFYDIAVSNVKLNSSNATLLIHPFFFK